MFTYDKQIKKKHRDLQSNNVFTVCRVPIAGKGHGHNGLITTTTTIPYPISYKGPNPRIQEILIISFNGQPQSEFHKMNSTNKIPLDVPLLILIV